ncbi:FAD-dependent monooxygenase [Actinomadura coerulea]|uniref:FAD-dependent monooxygenase n=1 Tax=Actinomadura coerulea TaxID=46159 RepID=UPI00341C0E2C
MIADVIVAGAGPTGLMLACELALAGVGVAVLERRPERTGQSRALNLQPRSAQVLDSRGMLEPLLKRAVDTLPAGHFAGLPLDYEPWGERQIGIPQARVEEHLEERLAERGVPVLRGHEVTGVDQDDTGVTVRAGREFRGRYLVACDGGRSTVRTLLDVPFPGRDGRVSAVVADITLTRERPGRWRLPSFDRPEDGVANVLPLENGLYRALIAGPEQQTAARDTPVTLDEVRRAVPDVREIRWASRFTDASRQVERYRHGRVLFAGDAAHVHSPTGGQGLNLGLQDAFNLGWKLAAALRGNTTVLDTYHAERHPVGAAVLANTRAQGVLLIPDEDVAALRGILADLLRIPESNRHLAGLISGLGIRYDLPGRHPLIGRTMPGLDPAVLHSGRHAVLELGDAPRHGGTPHPRGDLDVDAVLVRPDGHIAWADDGHEPLETALTRWT